MRALFKICSCLNLSVIMCPLAQSAHTDGKLALEVCGHRFLLSQNSAGKSLELIQQRIFTGYAMEEYFIKFCSSS